MIQDYLTIKKSQWTKLTQKDSRFFGRIYPVSSKKQVYEILKKIENEYRKATHIVFAYRIIDGDDILEYSTDAGEPTHSAGPPVLKVLKGKNLVNVCAYVVRFYGGTNLGIGGLIKAYSKSTHAAIVEAEIVKKINYIIVEIPTSYKQIGKVLYKVKKNMGSVEKIDYEKGVKIIAKIPMARLREFEVNK
ncbi:MAG: YigZ family protein [Candidatus Cloacimonadota bacterium]|nr:YigZ family protein [Candidatus Cloacimonadota bacterium]